MTQTDLLIIGAGPAGCSAAVYAARSGVKTVIAGGAMPGGQLLQTNDIENYAGFINPVPGYELMDNMHKQCKRLGVEITSDDIVKLEGDKPPFTLTAAGGKQYQALAVIIAAGASARWLGVKGEEKLKGHGVSACATCDGFFFKGKEVIVVGGGNTAFEDALFLSQICPKVTLVHRREGFRADAVTVEKVKNTPNISMMLNCVVEEVLDEVELGELQAARLNARAAAVRVASSFFMCLFPPILYQYGARRAPVRTGIICGLPDTPCRLRPRSRSSVR